MTVGPPVPPDGGSLGIATLAIAAMIAPSPDWCAIAADVELLADGQWVAQKTVVLEAWNAGTDSATSYRALDDDTQPRGAIQPNALPYFVKDGKRVPVGKLTFVRQEPARPRGARGFGAASAPRAEAASLSGRLDARARPPQNGARRAGEERATWRSGRSPTWRSECARWSARCASTATRSACA